MELVAATDYPDVRRQGFVMPKDGPFLHIPRGKEEKWGLYHEAACEVSSYTCQLDGVFVGMNGHTLEEHQEAEQEHCKVTITVEICWLTLTSASSHTT